MTTYLEAQQKAVGCLDEQLQIIACAGSGQDPGHLAAGRRDPGQSGGHPRNVVALMFTEEVAAELKERVLSVVEEEHGEIAGMAAMCIGTMHSYCPDLRSPGLTRGILRRRVPPRRCVSGGLRGSLHLAGVPDAAGDLRRIIVFRLVATEVLGYPATPVAQPSLVVGAKKPPTSTIELCETHFLQKSVSGVCPMCED